MVALGRHRALPVQPRMGLHTTHRSGKEPEGVKKAEKLFWEYEKMAKESKRSGTRKPSVRSTRGQSQLKQWENIFSSMAAPTFVTDKNLVITRINDAALNAMGYAREEVVGKMTCADLCKTPLCGTDNCTIKNCMKTGKAIFGETVATKRDGTQIPVSAQCSALFDENGEPIGGMEVIGDRSAAEEATFKMENILNSIGAPMFVTDKDLVSSPPTMPSLTRWATRAKRSSAK